jgi:hypothetical protein
MNLDQRGDPFAVSHSPVGGDRLLLLHRPRPWTIPAGVVSIFRPLLALP